MNVFDIIGPVMIGPSSSHTAGAVRIARTAARILGEEPRRAEIGLAGSYAQTFRGHGTDRALVAGLLGMRSDDERIRNSFEIARERGLEFGFTEVRIPRSHPNTARLHLYGNPADTGAGECVVQGSSVGGGNILITSVNGMETSFSGASDTLIIAHKDMPGMIAEVASLMAFHNINIGNFKLNRPRRGFQAVMILEIDGTAEGELADKLRSLPHINSVVFLKAHAEGEKDV
ncbi:MAG: L-serine ammonia-lyase, iron-sulfur-dependent subunit beta [Spirochaetaceae bacterium]|jgi:L-serine dehydratase|nr:L-serine ammonia-lyase, iron-sulfur-dependent subunit beta [Spirochaetaceae bacterium]